MSDTQPETRSPGSPLIWTKRVVRGAWNDLMSVYYANTPIWRVIKTAALVALGLFLWSGANLLLSYQPEWNFLYYAMAYGFILLLWGPLTHLLVVPTVIKLRRRGLEGRTGRIVRQASKINFTVFLLIVLVLGTYPLGVMTFEFQVPAGGGDGSSVNPQLQCTESGDVIHCHLSDSRGIDHVVVTSGGSTLVTIQESPFDFDVNESELASSGGDRQFVVELRDADGKTLRRYVRRADLIPG